MSNAKPIARFLYIPALMLLGACCCDKEVIAPPPPPPPAPVAPVVAPLNDVFFNYDRSELTPSTTAQLKTNANWLAANPGRKVILEGHCDERGTNEYNMALGERRVISAKEYLVSLGIDPSRMKTVTYGEERPFDAGHNEEAWAKNRRVHFVEE
ncbi:MAG: peptidoglycan-associated lipoprotein Pal [Chlorobiaceae bacterium]|nr:peptidoglycan-associated lipoprotein Pal [Chlorobiaceae bacterium]